MSGEAPEYRDIDCPSGDVCEWKCDLHTPDPITPERVTLLPAESIALTVALAQVRRGEAADPNTAAMCVLALARLAGKYDWTEETS